MKKICFRCKKRKDLESFYRHPMMRDGHLGKCKSCTKSDVAARYRNPDARIRIAEYERLRFQDPERKKKVLEYQRNRRKRHPLKNLARQKAQGLKKEPCEICGNRKSQAHHEDYRKPLEVKWLCFRHHREVHGQRVMK